MNHPAAKTFLHSGDLGDIVYFLRVMLEAGGGVLVIRPARFTRQRLTEERWRVLRPLLVVQPYVTAVRAWTGEAIDVDGDRFRKLIRRRRRRHGEGSIYEKWTLQDFMFLAAGRRPPRRSLPWLTIPATGGQTDSSVHKISPEVVINRSFRYRDEDFPWRRILATVLESVPQDRLAFVGLIKEFEDFCRVVGRGIPYLPTNDFLEVACCLSSAALFIGNQSCCLAVALGVGVPWVFVEESFDCPNCRFRRPGLFWGQAAHRLETYREVLNEVSTVEGTLN